MKRVAIYLRVSTLDQAKNGYSLAAQRKVLENWSKEHDYDVFNVYEDAGISGKDLKHRPAAVQMLTDAQKNKFSLILVWAVSRLTRRVSDLYYIWEHIDRHNVDLKSYTEPFDTTTVIGRAMMGVLGVFSQMEREMTSERVKLAMAERAAKGKRTCHEVLGYDKKGSDSFVINKTEAERIKYIFDKFLEYRNLSAVAELCALRGYCGKRGKKFKAQHIKTILTRPIYIGYNSYCGKIYKGDFESIISERQFEKVQQLLSGKKSK